MDELLIQHIKTDEENFSLIRDELKNMRENHLYHMEKDMTKVANDIEWMKGFFWKVAGVIITSVVGAILYLIIRIP